MRKEMGQRTYHYYHKLEKIPHNITKKRNYKFLSFERGYSDTKCEHYDLKNVTNIDKIDNFIKNSDIATTICKNYPHIYEYLLENTSYLNDFNPSDKTRIFYYTNSKSKITILNKRGKLIKPNNAHVQILEKFRIIDDFVCMSDDEKIQYIKDNVVIQNIRLSEDHTEKIRSNLYNSLYYLNYVEWDENVTKLQASYNKVYNITEHPKCVVCGNPVSSFNGHLLRYAETCSVTCSNHYIENINKRLTNNSDNTYKTNIGKNEDKICELLKYKIKCETFEKSKRIGPFICDGLINSNIVLEINERHHLYPKYQRTDIRKYKFLIDNGYKIFIIWDSISSRKKKITENLKKVQEKYREEFGDNIFQGYYSPAEQESKVKILTDEGFKSFSGILDKGLGKTLTIQTDKKTLTCSHDHILFKNDRDEISVKDLVIGDKIKTIDGNESIVGIIENESVEQLYDILGSENFKYTTNGIISHQCLLLDEIAWVEPISLVDDFMSSVLPTISRAKTSKILITSTPRGKDNIFYKMFNAATKKGTLEWNEFHPEEIKWDEVPGRDEAWKMKEVARLGSYEMFEQEYNCAFLDNSESSLGEALFDRFKNECKQPKHVLKEGAYKIWEEYDPEKIYVIGGDVSEGVGLDASVLEVLDVTNPKQIIQVAEYWTNKKGPSEFTNEVVDVCGNWGNPLLLIERNNQGAGVCDTLANTHMYQNLVSWGAKEAHKNKQNGMISHINTKYKAVENQRYFVNEAQSVTFRNIDTLKEFKNFVRYPNGSWKAKSGEHDDRVMAFVWGLMALYKDITELYFEVEALDDCDKPLVIKPIDQGLFKYKSSTSIYTNEEVDKIEHSNLAPMLFGGSGSMADSDMAELEAAGWVLPDHSVFSNPERNISSDQWAAMEKYFG